VVGPLQPIPPHWPHWVCAGPLEGCVVVGGFDPTEVVAGGFEPTEVVAGGLLPPGPSLMAGT
jgi:hypothetical protein